MVRFENGFKILPMRPRPRGWKRFNTSGAVMGLATGLAVVIAYLALSINTYLETQVFGVFSLGYGRFGPTEARVGLILVNLALLAGATGVLDIAGLAIAGLMLAGLGVRAARNLRILAEREPAGVVR